jgi:hypothetical protein
MKPIKFLPILFFLFLINCTDKEKSENLYEEYSLYQVYIFGKDFDTTTCSVSDYQFHTVLLLINDSIFIMTAMGPNRYIKGKYRNYNDSVILEFNHLVIPKESNKNITLMDSNYLDKQFALIIQKNNESVKVKLTKTLCHDNIFFKTGTEKILYGSPDFNGIPFSSRIQVLKEDSIWDKLEID